MTPLFKAATALRAQLDSGYRDTDHAIAELIDNSIEAEAKNIHIVIVKKQFQGAERKTWKVSEIAILDDGLGMPVTVLANALTFGYGTHTDLTDSINDNDYKKMGKYGFGLPNSSVSQARDIHVWSWQENIDNNTPYTISLNVDEILHGDSEGPAPVQQKNIKNKLISMFNAVGASFGSSGTLVYWNNTDRIKWTRSEALFSHLEETLGRIYRKYIVNDDVRIFVSVFRDPDFSKPEESTGVRQVRPNDPMFLMDNCICRDFIDPAIKKIAVPVPEENIDKYDFDVPYNGVVSKVRIRFSKILPEIRTRYSGNSSFGQLANRNCGVSVCRAKRELQLSSSWVDNVDPLNRWWGAEIDFPPALDDIFGVTNNKQAATKLDDFARIDIDDVVKEYNNSLPADPLRENELKTKNEIFEVMKKDGDTSWVLLKINDIIKTNIKQLFKAIKNEKSAYDRNQEKKKAGSFGSGSSSKIGAGVVDRTVGAEGKAQPLNEEQKTTVSTNYFNDLIKKNPVSAKDSVPTIEEIKEWLEKGSKVRFDEGELGTTTLFTIQKVINDRDAIILNKENRAIATILSAIVDPEAVSEENLRRQREELRIVLALLFYSWAYVEEEELTDSDFRLSRKIRSLVGEKLDELMGRASEELRMQ